MSEYIIEIVDMIKGEVSRKVIKAESYIEACKIGSKEADLLTYENKRTFEYRVYDKSEYKTN